MSCIGTAGHVDHGKSTLVKALTGIDPDRLAEEKERGMTIDLGFAWLTLPSGREVSIVDVPGHESFIKNMLAGVGGIDAALLVVAADEGVMPQTREHLAILDLLHVPYGVVALTKADLVDEEWLEMVREEVEELLSGTTLAQAAIVPVSAYTGLGLPVLLAELDHVLHRTVERQHIARPRLPIDRVFSLTGFGTIVTGTLLDGSFTLGQEVEVLPQGLRARIRSLQTHRRQVETAQVGSRLAMNLPNIARSDLERGNVVVLPGQLQPTLLLDAHIQLLKNAPYALPHNRLVELYVGAQEIPARVRLLDGDEVQPGQHAWVQLRLSRPAVVARRDRFILRLSSPGVTIGGGMVIDVQPRYHRRRQPEVLAALERLMQGSPEELILAALDRRIAPVQGVTKARAAQESRGYELKDIAQHSHLSEDVTLQILETLLLQERVRHIDLYWFALPVWETLTEEAVRLVQEYHRRYPLRSGISREEWRARLSLSPKMAAEVFTVLQAEEQLQAVTEHAAYRVGAAPGGLVRIPGFAPHFTAEQQRRIEQLEQRFRASPATPPTRAEVEAQVSAEVVAALVEQGRLVKLADGILFLREAYEHAVMQLVRYLRAHSSITVSEARDLLGTTRKYILPLLEQLDALHITHRQGDERVLGTVSWLSEREQVDR